MLEQFEVYSLSSLILILNLAEVARSCSVKRMFLNMSQINRKTTELEYLFNKVAGP